LKGSAMKLAWNELQLLAEKVGGPIEYRKQ